MIFKIGPIKEITGMEKVHMTKTRKSDEPRGLKDKLEPAPHIPSEGSPALSKKPSVEVLRGNPGGGGSALGGS